jgi:membrane protease YdiL (CAAX protease family)
MLAGKPWKPDAIARLLLSVFICIYAGSLASSGLYYGRVDGKPGWRFLVLAIGAAGFLAAAVILVRRPWTLENFRRRMFMLLACFYAGLSLGAWAQKVGGPVPSTGSVGHILIATISFQGAALLWIRRFLREHEVGWTEAFGLSHHRVQAVCFGLILACIFLPIGRELQRASMQLMEHMPHFPLKPEEQQAVQVLRVAAAWVDRVALGVATILLAPVAEEMLFRGILYPAIKQAGFPRLAFWGTSLLFAGIHLNLMILAPLFILAVLLTVLYERTNNLLAPIAAHAMFNGLNFALLYLTEG